MTYHGLSLECDGGVAKITIQSPPANILTVSLMESLSGVFQHLDEAADLRAVVIASGLEKIFISGADINQFIAWETEAQGIAGTKPGAELYARIASFRVPVICALSGAAFGGGLELALCCDFRVISRRAKVGLPEGGLGIVPGYGGTQRLPRLVGASMAKRMMFTGEPVTGEEAYRIGLAEVLTDPEDCLAEAMRLASVIAEKAPAAIRAEKCCVAYGAEHPLAEGLEYELRAVGRLCTTQDKLEGARSFLEKRKPQFTNR